jgi:uncharacterized SAM-binding protein YcdF (DUF218 family)
MVSGSRATRSLSYVCTTMFFILSKVLSFLLSPVIWIIIAFLLSLLVKNSRLKKRWMLAGFFMLLFFTNPFIRHLAFKCWEIPASDPARVKTYDLVIVPSGALGYYNADIRRPVYSPSVERIIQAVLLYKQGKAKTIFLSGGSGFLSLKQLRESEIVSRDMIIMGVNESDIWMENASRNTYENALYTARYLREKNFQGKLLLITSAYHMRRTLACFHKVGLQPDIFSVDSRSGRLTLSPAHLIIPDADNLTAWDMLIHEWAGCLFYKLVGYI